MQNIIPIWFIGGRVMNEENRIPLFLITLQEFARSGTPTPAAEPALTLSAALFTDDSKTGACHDR